MVEHTKSVLSEAHFLTKPLTYLLRSLIEWGNQIKRILIIDDDESIRRFLSRALRFEGFEPILSHGGRAAVAFAQSQCPDAILLDLMMPELDGLELLTAMREAGVSAPAVILSGDDDVSTRQRVAASDVVTHLIKPVSITELLGALEQAMGGKTGTSGDELVYERSTGT
jgi:DNA-binding response OmpR family regulator